MLGRDPATTLHHVRRLVDTGFLDGATGRRDPRLAGDPLSRHRQVVAAGDAGEGPRTRRRVPRGDGPRAGAHSSRRPGWACDMPEDVKDEFLERLGALWEEFRVRSDAAPAGPAWSIFFALHPDQNHPGHRLARFGSIPLGCRANYSRIEPELGVAPAQQYDSDDREQRSERGEDAELDPLERPVPAAG